MRKNRILIFGKGFIGEKLKEYFQCSISERRISSLEDVKEEIRKYNPKIIINAIGHTGKNSVDDCELEKDKTLFSNTFVPVLLAEISLRYNLKLIHISSGCIYNFNYLYDRPIDERKIPQFFDLFYSRTKIYAERAVEVLSDRFHILIVRIRVPIDNRPHPRNILTKLIKYRKVIDIPNSITYIPDFLKALEHLIKIDAKGIYNVVNKGSLRYPFLLEVYKKYVSDFGYEIIDYEELKLIRTNLILSVKKLENTGFKMRNIKEVLEECVENYIKY